MTFSLVPNETTLLVADTWGRHYTTLTKAMSIDRKKFLIKLFICLHLSKKSVNLVWYKNFTQKSE
jgi:hypothetical protein